MILPLLITFLVSHQSPRTVNRNAVEFVIGTVKLNSKSPSASLQNELTSPRDRGKKRKKEKAKK
jgi:hypothetical protein